MSDLRRRLIAISLIEAPIIAGLVILFALKVISVMTFTIIMVGLAGLVTVITLINVRLSTERGDDENFEF
jgi:hypothetical protein